jgi:lauroyl/myristoyl acyltransferase
MNSSMAGRRLLIKPLGVIRRIREAELRVSAACWPVVDDLLRCFLMVFILKPAASVLPRRSALAIARWCGSVMLYVPTSGRSVLATMRKAFGMEDADARRSAQESLAQPFHTFVVFHRILHRREHPNDWTVKERNNQGVVQLRQSGRSFIVATGHFSRESFATLCTPRICPGQVVTVSVALPAPSLRPHDIRLRVHFGQILRTLRYSFPDQKSVSIGGGAVRKLLKDLAQPSCQLIMSVDAFWTTTGSSTHMRPFAGMRARPFSIGTAALARLAQCSLVACGSYVEKDGTVVLEWGPVIKPPRREDEAADIRTTNELLDFLENAIGRCPTQYVLYIGEERRWNPALQTWEDPNERGALTQCCGGD